MADSKWPVGTICEIETATLARDLKGHRFVVRVPGKEPHTYVEQLVEITGDTAKNDDYGRPLALKVVVVKPDA